MPTRPAKATVQHTLGGVFGGEVEEIDPIIDDVVDDLKRLGYRVAGFRQYVVAENSGGCGVRLQSIATGNYHRVTQDLGPGSTSCNVDVEAMEQLAYSMMRELDNNPNLIVINRFGKREAEGAGFCCVIERAVELGIPVLTVVKPQWLDQWAEYSGELATILPADRKEIMGWYASIAEYQNPVTNIA